MTDLPKGFVTATHAALFRDGGERRCDVCDEALAPDDDDAEPFDPAKPPRPALPGRGLLLWTRGEERRYQEPPLCPSCASAIGVSALQRWEIEEEEG